MEPIWIIGASVLALLIGGLVTWLAMRGKMHSEGSEVQPIDCEGSPYSTIKDLELKLKVSKEAEEEALSVKGKLEDQISELSIHLEKKEDQYEELKSKIEELSSVPADSKEAALIQSLKDDVKKKTQEIESKEEEIEDLEDEISSIKKKLKSSKSEVEELSRKIDKSEKRAKSLEEDLLDVQSELSEIKEEDKSKSEAIEFVNAVLMAKDADDRDAKLIEEKVSKIESIIYDQYIQLQNDYFNDIEGWINKVYSLTYHWANLQRKSWLKRKKVIAFIGEFSAGKTSIVNRILSQDDPKCPKLPVSSKATTAIATYISYGEGFNSQFTDANGDLKNLSPEMFMKVNKDILSKVNVSSIIQYFVMKYRNENLMGLSILDTPGFSSNDEQDKNRTLSVIKEADALFWVVDANSGEVNRTSLKIISENVQDIPLYIIINKADTKSPAELSKLEAHIKQTMSRAEVAVEGYIRFSQKAPLSDIMTVISALPEGRKGDDIGVICLDLKRDLNNLQEELKDLKKSIRDVESYIENSEEVLDCDLQNIEAACDRIVRIPQYNSRLFAKDDYRMDRQQYDELYELCSSAKSDSDDIMNCFNGYKDLINTFHKLSESRENVKERYNETQRIYKYLMDAIKALDSQLHKEIEQDVEKILREEAKENNCGSSYNDGYVNQTEAHDNASNYQSPSTTSSSAEDLERGNQLYNRGQVEEAKFWYRRAARHGNKSAKDICRNLGITY